MKIETIISELKSAADPARRDAYKTMFRITSYNVCYTKLLRAGEAIMQIYRRDFAVEYKEDASPLTEADTCSNAIITAALQAR